MDKRQNLPSSAGNAEAIIREALDAVKSLEGAGIFATGYDLVPAFGDTRKMPALPRRWPSQRV